MRTKTRTAAPLSKEEESVLDALHFVLSFEELAEETRLEAAQLQSVLQALLASGDVQALEWSEEKKEFLAVELLQKPLTAYHYLATKEGLFRHHTA